MVTVVGGTWPTRRLGIDEAVDANICVGKERAKVQDYGQFRVRKESSCIKDMAFFFPWKRRKYLYLKPKELPSVGTIHIHCAFRSFVGRVLLAGTYPWKHSTSNFYRCWSCCRSLFNLC
jgi:hypothetical protein